MSNITRTNPLIGTQKSVYGDSSAGKLEKSTLVESVFVPHQQGFHSDSQARLPVAVHGLPALAREKCVVGGVPTFSHSTAAATPFGSVVGIHNRELDVFVEAPTLKVLLKQREGYPKNFLVELSAFRTEPLELFNGDVGVKFGSKVGNVLNDLPHPVLHEVSFSGFESFEAPLGSVTSLVHKALESCPPAHYLLTFHPNIFPIVELLENFAVWGENRNSEALAVHIDAEDIVSCGDFDLFGEKSDNLAIGGQAVSLTHPATSNQIGVSLKVPVISDWNGDAPSGIHAKLDEKSALCVECFTVPRYIELDGDCLDCFTVVTNNTAFNATNHLAVEGCGGLAG